MLTWQRLVAILENIGGNFLFILKDMSTFPFQGSVGGMKGKERNKKERKSQGYF